MEDFACNPAIRGLSKTLAVFIAPNEVKMAVILSRLLLSENDKATMGSRILEGG